MGSELPFFAIFGGVTAFILFTTAIGIAATVFWIVELIDALRRQFNDDATKIIWVLVIIFTHFIGALIYYFAGKPMGRLPGQTYNSF